MSNFEGVSSISELTPWVLLHTVEVEIFQNIIVIKDVKYSQTCLEIWDYM